MAKKSKYNHLSREQLEAKLEKLERERYGLVWEDKEEDVAKQCDTELPVLKEDTSREIISDATKPYNFIIEGDNYHSLYTLNFTHKKKIDVIYIDPPYNTGKKNEWKYNDRYVDSNDKFKHSKWLSFLSKRLRQSKNLLKKSGVLFISIDDNEVAQLKMLCDNVFGEQNFINIICQKSRHSISNDLIISQNHNFILLYAKDKNVLFQNRFSFRFKQKDFKGYKNPDNDPKGEWKLNPVDGPGGASKQNPHYEFLGIVGYWRYSKEEMQRMYDEGLIVKRGKTLGKKYYLKDAIESGVKSATTWWDDVGTTTEGTRELEKILGENDMLNNPKPLSLLTKIIDLSTNNTESAIILDFFAGSGTTGHAVLELNKEDGGNRQFILCTNNENSICEEVTYPRIKTAITGKRQDDSKYSEGTPANVKYFKQTFVPNISSDKDKRELVNRSTELLCMAENTFKQVVKRTAKSEFAIFKNATQQTAIIYDEESIEKCVNKLNSINFSLETVIYVFSYDHTYDEESFENLKINFSVKPIPEAILNVYRKIAKMKKK
jgi:adenine-specific DNA-methyltransferase